MTEQEWQQSTDPSAMREFLRLKVKPSERKLRLFGLACCQRFMHLLTDQRSLQAFDVASRFVERKATHQERVSALEAAWKAVASQYDETTTAAAMAAARAAAQAVDADWPLLAVLFEPSGENGRAYAWRAVQDALFFIDRHDQCALLHDIFGNPFRLPAIDPAWLAWNGRTVPNIAQAIYDERAFDRLPILADALEEAGCNNEAILAHCRGPGPHVRGCWALDLLLGKE